MEDFALFWALDLVVKYGTAPFIQKHHQSVQFG